MRSLKELYQLLEKDMIDNPYGSGFICNRITCSPSFTLEERDELKKNFMFNRPTHDLHHIFWIKPLYSECSWNWFGNGEGAYQLRIEFVKYLIDNHTVYERIST